MLSWNQVAGRVLPFLPLLFTTLAAVLLLWFAYWILLGRHADLDKNRRFPRQFILLGLTLVCMVSIVFVMPIGDAMRNQLIGLMGILVSAIVALSSTTVVANLMAGILLRVTKPFRIGDFIRVDEHFGRVSDRGLFDTEIQSESRDLIALPNTYLIRTPVTTIRSSGTIVSTTISLGYDSHHSQVEPLLIHAAESCGLEEPFVHILELGNYAITYRIAGFLTEVKGLITARSNLCRAVLDQLHDQDIEIMSPSYMNQRRLDPERKIMPRAVQKEIPQEARTAEEIAFDKAEQAELLEKQRQDLIHGIEAMESGLKNATGKGEATRIKSQIEDSRERLKALEESIKDVKTDAPDNQTGTANQ